MFSVSIVITCYNLENFIGEAIESVLHQDYINPTQIIVVDDASTDSSLEIIQSFHSLELVQHKFNSGVLLATISGLRLCTGDLIFFLDGDDLWNPSKLTRCVKPFEIDPELCLITHDINYISRSGRPLSIVSRPSECLSRHSDPSALVRKGILELDDYVWLGSAYGVHRRNARIAEFCDWAEQLPCPRKTYQDWPLAFWVASLDSSRCAYVDKTLLSYRIHDRNHSGSASSVPKLLSNLEKGYNTCESIAKLSQLRMMSDIITEIALARQAHYSFLILLYKGSKLLSIQKLLLLQRTFALTPSVLIKEWIRLLSCLILGPKLCTALSANLNHLWLRSR